MNGRSALSTLPHARRVGRVDRGDRVDRSVELIVYWADPPTPDDRADRVDWSC